MTSVTIDSVLLKKIVRKLYEEKLITKTEKDRILTLLNKSIKKSAG